MKRRGSDTLFSFYAPPSSEAGVKLPQSHTTKREESCTSMTILMTILMDTMRAVTASQLRSEVGSSPSHSNKT